MLCMQLEIWFPPTLTFSFKFFRQVMSKLQCTSTHTHHLTLNMRYWRKPSLGLLLQSDLVPSDSRIQLPKFQLRVAHPNQANSSHVLHFATATDRGAEDKMLEKTELLKLCHGTEDSEAEFSFLQLLSSELANEMFGLRCFQLMVLLPFYTHSSTERPCAALF